MEQGTKQYIAREAIVGLERITTTALTEATQRDHLVAAAQAFGYAKSACEREVAKIDAVRATRNQRASAAAQVAAASARAAAFIAAHASAP